MRDSIRANDSEAVPRPSSRDGEHASDSLELSADAAEFASLALEISLAVLGGHWNCKPFPARNCAQQGELDVRED